VTGKEAAENIGCLVLILAMPFAAVGGTDMIVNAYGAPFEVAQIEQLRADSAGVDPAQAEDVIGQVTVWNQTIASMKARNALVWTDFMTADVWDTIQPIEVPR
jgi:hypothetical protein